MEEVVRLVQRLNFGVKDFFNVAIIGDINDLVKAKDWVDNKMGPCSEIGYVIKKKCPSFK